MKIVRIDYANDRSERVVKTGIKTEEEAAKLAVAMARAERDRLPRSLEAKISIWGPKEYAVYSCQYNLVGFRVVLTQEEERELNRKTVAEPRPTMNVGEIVVKPLFAAKA